MSHITRSIGREGALVEVVVEVFTARRRTLEHTGLTIPEPAVIKAQLDTGAHRTGVDRAVLAALELRGEIDIEPILTSSTDDEPHPAPVYVVNLAILGVSGNRVFDTHRVLAHVFGPNEETRALIGRDILDQCHLTYDGPGKTFSLLF
jgi:hypothetical protein